MPHATWTARQSLPSTLPLQGLLDSDVCTPAWVICAETARDLGARRPHAPRVPRWRRRGAPLPHRSARLVYADHLAVGGAPVVDVRAVVLAGALDLPVGLLEAGERKQQLD